MPLPSFPKFEQPYKLTCLYISLSACFPFPGFPFRGRQSICRRAYASDRSGEIHPYHLAKIYGREGHCHIIAFIGVGKHHYVSLTNFIFLPQPLHISFPLHADTPGKAFKAMIHGQSTSRPNLPSGFRQFFRILLSIVYIPLFYSPFPLKHPQKNSAPRESNAGFPTLLKRARCFFAIIYCRPAPKPRRPANPSPGLSKRSGPLAA